MQELKRCWFTHRWGTESLKNFLWFLFSVCISAISTLNLPAQTGNAQAGNDRTGDVQTGDVQTSDVQTGNDRTRDDVLKEYLAALDGYDIPTKIEECDFILSNCDSASRQETALKVFSHFRDSKLMGDENVAVHVADRWILEQTAQPSPHGPESSVPGCRISPDTLAAVRSYADFNRTSLLGAEAPLLPEAGMDSFSSEKPTVLWFYDPDCAKCKVEAVRLEDFFRRRCDCNLVTFCIGDDSGKWEDFLRSHFTGIPGARHLSDPTDATDFRHKYSVTATPRMFLIGTDGTVIGRMLDTESLELLLEERKKHEKEAVTELFYRLVPLRGEDAKNALEYIIDTRILCKNSPFDTSEDSLMVVNFARIQKELLSKARPGTKIATIKVRSSLNGHKQKVYRLDRLGHAAGRLHPNSPSLTRKEAREAGGKTIIIFHTSGCHQCEAELAAAKSLKINALDINIDEIQSSSPETFARLIDSFDLTTLPLLIETDRRGIILRRYFSLTD